MLTSKQPFVFNKTEHHGGKVTNTSNQVYLQLLRGEPDSRLVPAWEARRFHKFRYNLNDTEMASTYVPFAAKHGVNQKVRA